ERFAPRAYLAPMRTRGNESHRRRKRTQHLGVKPDLVRRSRHVIASVSDSRPGETTHAPSQPSMRFAGGRLDERCTGSVRRSKVSARAYGDFPPALGANNERWAHVHAR